MLRAADQGNAYAQVKYAWMLEKGIGIRQDYSESAKWYEKAAEQGLALGQINLSLLLASGAPGKKDPVNAYKWMRLATKAGNKGAATFLPTIAAEMTPKQIAQANLLVSKFVARPKIEDIPREKTPKTTQ